MIEAWAVIFLMIVALRSSRVVTLREWDEYLSISSFRAVISPRIALIVFLTRVSSASEGRSFDVKRWERREDEELFPVRLRSFENMAECSVPACVESEEA